VTARLTAIVLGADAGEELARCLDALRFADEILLVDPGSRDRSREIAAARGARVLPRPPEGPDAQRNWAQAQAASPWVLFLDPGEVVTAELAAALRAAAGRETGPAAYSVRRVYHFLGRPLSWSGLGEGRAVRMLRRRSVRWEAGSPRVDGEIGALDGVLEHHPYRTLAAYWDVLERSGPAEAARERERGRRGGCLSLLLRPQAAFLRTYLWHRGFLQGLHGFVLGGLAAFSAFTREMRLWEGRLPPDAARPPRGPRVEAPAREGPPVSVLIPTGNEEVNIEGALESAAWAEEVFVVDSFSTDRTVDLARPRATRLVQHEYLGPAAQKNWALPQTAHRWTLVVDADERITPDLALEVRRVLAAGPRAGGYWIGRTNHFLGRSIRFGGWAGDTVIRLFDRSRARYRDVAVHEEVEVDGPVGRLRGRLLHYSYRGVDQYWPKIRRYTDWGALQARDDGRRAGAWQVIGRPIGRFLRAYGLRLGFLDGTHGLAIALMSSFSVFHKYARLWEIGLHGEAAAGKAAPGARRMAGGGR
jgi:glycosyltransferase involved in cell wall biosynthesis